MGKNKKLKKVSDLGEGPERRGGVTAKEIYDERRYRQASSGQVFRRGGRFTAGVGGGWGGGGGWVRGTKVVFRLRMSLRRG